MWRLNSDSRPRDGTAPGVLIWFALALLPAFAFTTFATQSYRAEQHRLGAEWFARGDAALAAGRPEEAIGHFRNALTFSREDRQYRLRLAQALAAAGRTTESRAHLVTLRETQPGNGPVNLELARLAARERDVEEAHRYYHLAIEGAWSDAAEARRRASRLELARFLVEEGALSQAQAELVALQGDLPEDPAARKQVAALMLGADLPERARTIYDGILRNNSRDPEALAGAGRAALAEGNFATAAALLARAETAGATADAVRRSLATARRVVQLDPYARRLSTRERAARAQRAFAAAEARLGACLGRTASPQPAQLQAEVRDLKAAVGAQVPRDLDVIDSVMDLVFRIALAAAELCGEPQESDDRALWLLARQRSQGTL